MKFDLKNVSQGFYFIEDQKDKMRSGIEFLGKKSSWTGLLALPATIGYLSLDIIKIVTFIGESVIKGLANLFGAPFNKNCDAKKGATILAVCAPLACLFAATAVSHALLVFYKTLTEPHLISKPFTICLDTRA